MNDGDAFTARIVEREPQPTAAVRIQQRMAELDLAAAFNRSLPLVEQKVRDAGGTIAGPSYGRYHRFGPDIVDVEIGFPVNAPVPGLPALEDGESGSVGSSQLPGGSLASTEYVGSYDGLGGVYDRLHDWIHAQPGYDDGPGPWESYLSMPGQAPDGEPRTEIVWPLRPE